MRPGRLPLALVALAVAGARAGAGRSHGLGVPYAGLKRYGTYILTLWLVTAVAAMGVNLIVGYAGQETLAQAAFLGIGAYTTALMTKAGMPFGVAFLASGRSPPSWSASCSASRRCGCRSTTSPS